MIFLKTGFNRLFTILQIALIVLPLSLEIHAAGDVDTAFNSALVQVRNASSIDQNRVNKIAIQPDGKVLVAGYFQSAGKVSRSGIVRLNTDGTIDATFNPPVVFKNDGIFSRYGGDIFAVAVQPDGKILIGGDFSTVGGLTRPGFARLNSDGSLDTTFNILTGGATLTGTILDIKVGTDGKITFAGGFTYSGAGGTRYGVARVLSDATSDFSFVSPTLFTSTTVVYRVEVLAGNKTLVSGITANGSTGIGFIYRLNNDGSLDSTFSSITTSGSNSGSNAVTALRIQPDGKILGGGSFTTVNGFPLNGLARFNADGTVDTTFNLTGAGPNGFIYDIELTSTGMILVGGSFSTYNSANRMNVALLNQNGNLDNSLIYTGVSRDVKDVEVLPDGKILVGAVVRQDSVLPALTKLNADGSVDTSFSLLLGNSGTSYKIFVQPDGKILIGGAFTHTDNQPFLNLSRVNADGTFDPTFTPAAFSGEVYGLDVRASDGKILVATVNGIRRYNANGSLDVFVGGSGGASYDAKFLTGGGAVISSNLHLRKTLETGVLVSSFDVAADGAIRRILIQPDGKFIIAGDFTTVGGAGRGRIARVNADGTLDTTFNPAGGANNSIFDAVLQPDGKIVVGGNFSGINFNNNYKYLARLNSDGSLDTSFHPIVEGGVQSLRFQPDGKILVGGGIYTVNGIARTRIARVNSDGSLDASFNPVAGADNAVLSIDLEANGNIIIGGTFTHFNNLDRLGIARLLSVNTARTQFDFDGDGKADISVFRPSAGAWYVQGSQNGFAGYSFGASGDKIVPADFDGDGKTDLAVFRNGTWLIQRSTLGLVSTAFGAATDIPVPADYDGDGKADIAVFRPSIGTWYIQQSTAGFTGIAFGTTGDKPVAADYDGDGKADVAVNRAGTWYIQRSQLGFTGLVFGDGNDISVPADYDGDGKVDVAVYRPSNGTWYLNRSQLGFTGAAFGDAADKPVPADYDGDGKADIAVFRPSIGTWYLLRSTQGFAGTAFGISEDLPIQNAFVR